MFLQKLKKNLFIFSLHMTYKLIDNDQSEDEKNMFKRKSKFKSKL